MNTSGLTCRSLLLGREIYRILKSRSVISKNQSNFFRLFSLTAAKSSSMPPVASLPGSGHVDRASVEAKNPIESTNQQTANGFLKSPMLRISVDGNISSGKSTLVTTLVELLPKEMNFQVEIVPEPLDKWTNLKGHNLLDKLYKDVTKNNFMFQHYVQLTRLMDTVKSPDINSIDGYSGTVRIMERSLQNNRLTI